MIFLRFENITYHRVISEKNPGKSFILQNPAKSMLYNSWIGRGGVQWTATLQQRLIIAITTHLLLAIQVDCSEGINTSYCQCIDLGVNGVL